MGWGLHVGHIPLAGDGRGFAGAQLVQDADSAIGAEATLTGSHAEAYVAAQVVQSDGRVALRCALQHRTGYQLALADQLRLKVFIFDFVEPMTEPVVSLFDTGHGCSGGAAGARNAQLSAGCIDSGLGHQAEGRPFASGDGDEAAHAVALLVVEQGDGSGGVTAVLG